MGVKWQAVAAMALGMATVARAHDEPPGCGSAGVAMIVSLFRGDGTTGLRGAASECEHLAYRVTLRQAGAGGCAFSDGTLTLMTPDGTVYPLETAVPLTGGPGSPPLQSPFIPYTVRPRDVANGKIRAIARYEGGVIHDTAVDTPGVSAMVDRNAEIVACSDADPCTHDVCDPTKAGLAACSNPPVCDDGDPLTDDTCAAGRCTFTPIASSDRLACGEWGGDSQ